ncbi:MRPL37 [Cordylochernes scorpioides]|uniref:MRPL37 n=1 Tax=Cordylochernes scorpioides TaxID=51811 RepID=A0ABY6L2P6_9ARAC|nr:MRPL37 [Cordylochernes scorpioides]
MTQNKATKCQMEGGCNYDAHAKWFTELFSEFKPQCLCSTKMRLTQIALQKNNILHRISYPFTFKKIFKRRSKLPVLEHVTSLPPKVDGSKIEVVNINEYIYPKPTFPEKYDPLKEILKTPPLEKMPKAAYFISNRTRLVEGHKQMSNLIKTVVYEGSLPPSIQSLAEDMAPHEKQVRELVLDATIRNGRQIKLGKVIDVTQPHIFKPTEYSVSLRVQLKQLTQNLLLFHNQRLVVQDLSAFLSRTIIPLVTTRILVPREEQLLGFCMEQDHLLASKDPLPPVAGPEEVRATESQSLMDIYPLLPTLDLKPTDIYTDSQINCELPWVNFIPLIYGYAEHQPNSYPHTAIMIHKEHSWFFPTMRISRSMATCFANAATVARKLYGENVGELPQPVVTQCIHLDVHGLYLVVYQLNTLDLTSPTGVKNQAWVESTGPLYTRAKWYEGLQDLDVAPLGKMAALLNNGLN